MESEYTLAQYNHDFYEGSGRSHWRSVLEAGLIAALENVTYPHREVLTINVYLPHPDDGKIYELMMFTTDFDLSIYFEIDNNPVKTIFGEALTECLEFRYYGTRRQLRQKNKHAKRTNINRL